MVFMDKKLQPKGFYTAFVTETYRTVFKMNRIRDQISGAKSESYTNIMRINAKTGDVSA